MPVPVSCPGDEVATDFGCVPSDPILFSAFFYKIGLGVLAMVAMITMLVGSYYVATSRGNLEQLNKGKSYIFYSIAGIFLAVLGFVLMQVVAGGIVGIPGFE